MLNYLPRTLQPKAKAALHEIWMAETRSDAQRAFDQFITSFGAKYPKAIERLSKDRTKLLAFYDFPAEHRIHLRTSNTIESAFHRAPPHRPDQGLPDRATECFP